MSVKMRIAIEQLIATKTAEALIAAGYKLSVHDGEEMVLEDCDDVETVLKAMFSTDEDMLYAVRDTPPAHQGWVRFIYGNSGYDVINDYTTGLENVLEPVLKYYDLIDDGQFVIEIKPTPYSWNNQHGWGKLAPKEVA